MKHVAFLLFRSTDEISSVVGRALSKGHPIRIRKEKKKKKKNRKTGLHERFAIREGRRKRGQERKHSTLSANKPGFVVISFCGARVQSRAHRERPCMYTDIPPTRNTTSHTNATTRDAYVRVRKRVGWSGSDNRESGDGYLSYVSSAIAATVEEQIGRNKHGATSSASNPLSVEDPR